MLNQRAVISFTFDDFPHSAVSNGARILNKYNARGTFYVVGSYSGRVVDGVSQYSLEDLSTVVARGHEIGCHTFHHPRVSTLTASALRQEVYLNAKYVAGYFPNFVMRTFAYPYGDVSPSAARKLGRQFSGCRSSDPGLNVGRVDLAMLRSVRLYERLMNRQAVSEVIQETIDRNAWLIFYTHDVADEASNVGCTPSLFEHAVRAASMSGAAILPVCETIAAISSASLR